MNYEQQKWNANYDFTLSKAVHGKRHKNNFTIYRF